MLNYIIKLIKEKLGSNLGKDIGLTLVGQLAIMILALIINKILSNELGVEGYGQYSIIKKSASVLSFVMLSGMGIALPRYLATYIAQKNSKQAKSTILASLIVVLTISIVVIAIFILTKHVMESVITGSNETGLYFSAFFYAFSLTISSLLFAYYRGVNAFLRFSVSQITIQVVITIIALLYGSNLFLILNMWAATTLIYVFISSILEYRRNKLYMENQVNWIHNIFPQLKILFGYGLPRLVGDFLLFSFAAFPLIFISQQISIEASSFFAVGLMLVSIVTPLFSFSGMVLLPYVSSSIAQNNFSKADKLIAKLTILYGVISLIAITSLWFGIDVFIRLFFTKEFLPSAGVSRILVATIFSESIYLLLRNPIDAVSKIPYNTYNLLISFLSLVFLFYFSHTLKQYAVSYLIVSLLKACLTFISWRLCRKTV